MKNFSSFSEEMKILNEKLIVFRNKRSKYGRVIFLAGGAASGKDFALLNFMDVSKTTDKIRDVDALKVAFLKLDKLKKRYPEIRNLNLRNPDDVFKLHMFVKDMGVNDKSLDLLLQDLRGRTLPNLVFNITLKNRDDVDKVIPRLIEVGYDPKDIHLVWVLTNFAVAVKANRKRERVVPEDVLLKTHEGASRTMFDIIKGNVPKNLDGEIYVINNNRENTVFFTDKDGNPIVNKRKFSPRIVFVKRKDDKGSKTKPKTLKYGDEIIMKDGKYYEVKVQPSELIASKFLKENPDWEILKVEDPEPQFVIKDFLAVKLKEAGKSLAPQKEVKKQVLKWMQENMPKSKNINDVWREVVDMSNS